MGAWGFADALAGIGMLPLTNPLVQDVVDATLAARSPLRSTAPAFVAFSLSFPISPTPCPKRVPAPKRPSLASPIAQNSWPHPQTCGVAAYLVSSCTYRVLVPRDRRRCTVHRAAEPCPPSRYWSGAAQSLLSAFLQKAHHTPKRFFLLAYFFNNTKPATSRPTTTCVPA